jgi:hypothetical protein
MKKIIFALFVLFAISSCSNEKEEDIKVPDNPMIGTKWEAYDDISSLIFGYTISRLEFLDDKNFQDIAITKGNVRDIDKGIYTYSNDTVVLTYTKYYSDGTDRILHCTVSGSLLVTNQGTISGGFLTYQKK